MRFFLSILLLAFAAGEAGAADALRVEVEFFEGEQSTPSNRATVHSAGRWVRIEQQPSEGTAPPIFLYRGDQDRIYSIVESARRYVTLERRMLAVLGAGRGSAARAVDEQLGSVPVDQQRAFGHLLGASSLRASGASGLNGANDAKTALRIERLPGEGRVAGIDCRNVLLERAGRPLAKGCIADWATVGLEPADVEVFRDLAGLTHSAMGARLPMPIELVPGQPLDLVVQFGGFPLAFERVGQAPEASAIRVAAVERVTVPDSLFEVPADFTASSGMAGLARFASLFKPSASAPTTASAEQAVPAAMDPAAEPGFEAASIADTRPPPRRSTPRRTPNPYRSISLFDDPD